MITGVCRKTATSFVLRWTSPQRTAATSKTSRGQFEDTLSSPFIIFPGEGVGSLLYPWFEARGGVSVRTTAQRGTREEVLVSKIEKTPLKAGAGGRCNGSQLAAPCFCVLLSALRNREADI